ncbi:hypothetical protein [Methanonatronarchaeum sp. AMET-Sl]|uniref:hypothetical protein n=1 Tax=Methanonatronarchaeum sp. AMET-Sl TaxID=3037654 RepID=UPI00244E0658|nr:hypothetical protein [Methanonatronarchaeum sp. AMET-Sl]WGI18000.1 hypothetical protein QEN48_03065 [Methanonatronarchaeum sp. AMET-Sl]
MKKTYKIVILTALILLLAFAPGCLGEAQETPTYPDAEKIDIPKDLSQDIFDEIGFEGIINAYKTTDTPDEIMDWYEEEMDNQEWTDIFSKAGIPFWEKENTLHGIQILEPDEAQEEFDVNKTVIITITIPPIEI